MDKKITLARKQVFIGHSFSPEDTEVVDKVKNFLSYFNLDIDSGERPDARSISEKIKTRIIDCNIFLGIFTKRQKLGDTDKYSTSQWVIEEKTYAVSLNKKILLYREEGVQFSPGLQADYEFIKFSRSHLSDALVKSIPYIFSVIAYETDSISETEQPIDRHESLRLIKEFIDHGLNSTQSEDAQNYIFRKSLCEGMATIQFQGDYDSLAHFIDFMNGQGYKIAPISKQLFLRYSVISKEGIENTRLRLGANT